MRARKVQVVWLKRDLRLADHWPLVRAIETGSVVGLYVFEPSVWTASDADRCHFDFVVQSLMELRAAWAARGGGLVVRTGEVPAVLAALRQQLAESGAGSMDGLWAHEETGAAVTFRRDVLVGRWCAQSGVKLTEIAQTGVVRRLESRDGWAGLWQARMDSVMAEVPERIVSPAGLGERNLGEIPTALELAVAGNPKPEAKAGGERAAHLELESFLSVRGVNYQKDMSSPVAGWTGCSRLSPYLAWGCISVRQVYQRTRKRTAELGYLAELGAKVDRRWFASLRSFESRLRWHCHFMQKLESEPEIEHCNFNRTYDGMREDFFATPEAQRRFEAWKAGRTGYPMIDACMRALHAGGMEQPFGQEL